MPYIKQDRRKEVDHIVDEMVKAKIDAKGDLNYILCRLCIKTVKPGYENYKSFINELTEASHELRRRFLVEYEKSKMIENGDI